MILILSAAFLLFTVFLAVFNNRRSEGTLRFVFRISNLILLGLILLELIFALVVCFKDLNDSSGHTRNGGGILGGITYYRTDSDGYVFHQSQFLSPGSEFKILKEDAELPKSAEFLKGVIIYTNGPYKTSITTGSTHPLWINVVKISTDFFFPVLFAGLCELAALFVLDLCIFIIILVKRKKAGSAPGKE